MHIIRHLRALADRSAYSRVITSKWLKEWAEMDVTDPETGEVTMKWVVKSRSPGKRKRRVHRKVKRWRNTHGFEVVNDSLALVPGIARIIASHLESLSDLEGYDVELLGGFDEEPDWFDSSPPQCGQLVPAA